MTNSQSIVRGAFFIVASELSFALSAAIIKLVSASLPNESIVFFRNLFGLVILTPLLLRAGTQILQTDRLHLHLLRSGIGIGAMYCFFYAKRSSFFGRFDVNQINYSLNDSFCIFNLASRKYFSASRGKYSEDTVGECATSNLTQSITKG